VLVSGFIVGSYATPSRLITPERQTDFVR